MKFLAILMFLCSNFIFSQIKVDWPENKIQYLKQTPDSTYKSWNDFYTELYSFQKECYSKGLLEFSIDSITTLDSLLFTPHINIGKPYSWNSINLISRGIKIPKKIVANWKGKLVTSEDLTLRIDNIINFFQKNG